MLSGGKKKNKSESTKQGVFQQTIIQQHLSKLWQEQMNTLISMQNLILKCMYALKLFSEVGVTAHHGYDELC